MIKRMKFVSIPVRDQDKALAFGYLSMFAGVVVLLYERLPAALTAAAVGFVLVSVLHLTEFRGDVRVYWQREKSLEPRPQPARPT